MAYNQPDPSAPGGGGRPTLPPASSSSDQKESGSLNWSDAAGRAYSVGRTGESYGKGAQARSSNDLPPLSESDSQEMSVSRMFNAPPLAIVDSPGSADDNLKVASKQPGFSFIASPQAQAKVSNKQAYQAGPAPQALFQGPALEPQAPVESAENYLLQVEASTSTPKEIEVRNLKLFVNPLDNPLDKLVSKVLNSVEESLLTGLGSNEKLFDSASVENFSKDPLENDLLESNQEPLTTEFSVDTRHPTSNHQLSQHMNTNNLLDQNLNSEVLLQSRLQPRLQQDSAPQIGERGRVNSSLIRIIGNLAKDDEPVKDAKVASFPGFLVDPKFAGDHHQPAKRTTAQATASQPAARRSIGLELASDDEVRDASQLGRVKVRLADVRCVDQHEVTADRPIDPFRHVNSRHGEIQTKYSALDCRLSKSLRPDGTSMEVKTANDYSSVTTIESESGTSMVVHDRYRRPVYEHYIFDGGVWTFSELTYSDDGKIRPFPSEKLTINSDGTVTSFSFSDMGQLKNRYDYPALV
jgi:hypothetical protein